jgi:uncharacterized protein (DUF885 family)
MRLYQSLFFILAVVSSVFSQNLKPVADRLAAQNALFEEQYETDLRNFPERATAFGDYRYNDKLADRSLDAITQYYKTDRAFLTRLEAIPSTGFSDQDQLSHDLLIRVLQQRIADFDLKEYEMPINQQNGIHTSLADLPLSVPLDSVKHYEDYIARLHQIPRVLSQNTEVLRAGMKDKLMPVRFLLEKLPVQCQGIIEADPFLLPTKKYPASISPEDQKRLTQQITDAVNVDVIPAYKTFAAFLRTEYAPEGRTTLAVTSLPDGQKRYENDVYGRTTTRMKPDDIHQLGLREIDRIQAEMIAIAKKEGFADLAAFRASLKTNPKYIPTSAEQILDDFRHYIAQMEPKLPELFTLLPKSPVTVEAIPAFQSAAATHYVTGTPDGKRPGRVVVATSNFAERSLIDNEAIAYHEGIPGHHMVSASTHIPKGGLCTQSNSARRSGSTKTRSRTTAASRQNFSEQYAWWSTRESTRRDGHGIKSWTSSASLVRLMSLLSSPRPTATSLGPRKPSVTSSASSRSANSANAPGRNWGSSLISAASTTRCSTAEPFPSISSRPARTNGSHNKRSK